MKTKPPRTLPTHSVHLLAGEALVYPRGTITPKRAAMLVTAADEELTEDVMLAWFKQAGQDGKNAANALQRLLDAPNRTNAFAFVLHAVRVLGPLPLPTPKPWQPKPRR